MSPPVTALESQLLRALPPLYQRTRKPATATLAARIQLVRPVRNLESSALIHSLIHSLDRIHLEVSQTEAEVAALTRRYGRAQDDLTRRAVVEAYLKETVTDRAALRGDLEALDRWLGIDTLRERMDRKRQLLLIEEEMALRCVAGILRTTKVFTADEGALRHAGLVLLDRALGSPRLMTQLAGAEAVRELLLTTPAVLQAVPDVALALKSVIDHEDAHPFVQAEALLALSIADPRAGLLLLRTRLEQPSAHPRDFLFRRHALELCVPRLPEDEQVALLGHVSRSDASEYVRMGACELLSGAGRRVELLREAAGLSRPKEPSAKVRATAVMALARSVTWAEQTLPSVASALASVLEAEDSELVLRVTCEQAAAVAESVTAETFAPVSAGLLTAITQLRGRADLSGAVLESAAACDQILRRGVDPVRRAWTKHFGAAARNIEAGGSAKVIVEPPPEGLPPLPDDSIWLGAVLADLSTTDLGLYAERKGNHVKLWRGDRFTRRAWRIWHEFTRPAPNKRQGFVHTVGRVVRGSLRAHPARMEEITETTVPGERVFVPSEGGWARHLPTVDDLVDLPLTTSEPIQVFSSHGVTTLRPPESMWRRMGNKLKLTFRYRDFVGTRLSSLNGQEPRERRRYVEKVRQELGVELDFQPYAEGEAVPPKLGTLFGSGAGRLSSVLLAFAGSGTDLLVQVRERLMENEAYFLGISGNGLGALALFTAGLFSLFLWSAFSRRKSVKQARASVPLCIGGWGTRGKSGTERLKAALLGGMGFDVFAKTTGSEAMFVHSAPGAPPVEFFIYRPYDKATIWEQRDMVQLGSRLGVEVFLWECMALQPSFVELLQNDWMRDDYATLTNAYPDHEDLQGPAGINVAQVITNFMPNGKTVVTTEDHFLPLFQDVARQRDTKLRHSPWWEAELIPDELLNLFPYREHPRNMALVATLGEQLGVPRPVALALMAEYVQPEIGVLKVFPDAKVRGRTLSFINGHSANERTGFLNNWVRTGLDRVHPETDPDRAVLTVINNRWDRVSRSEVFARIMVEDAPADRHLLIGTNLVGLQKYLQTAMDTYLGRLELVSADDLGTPDGQQRASERVARELARLKVPRPSVDTFIDRLGRYARGASRTLAISPDLRLELSTALRGDGDELRVERVRQELGALLGAKVEASLVEGGPADELPEVLEPASVEEVRDHGLYLLARMVIHARLGKRLPREATGTDTAESLASFHKEFKEAFRGLFQEQIIPVEDPLATGDQIVAACARAAAPGLRVSIMGAQNIKGTGLDWVYRWLALDRVSIALKTLETSRAVEARRRALESLEAFGDHGIVDSGLSRAVLPRLAAAAEDPEEADRLRRLADAAQTIHEAKVAALQQVRAGTFKAKAVHSFEKAFDYLDSVRRRQISEDLIEDLVAGRISHARGAVETRRLQERQKGGWLGKELQGTFAAVRSLVTRRPKAQSVPPREQVLPDAAPQPLLRSDFLRALGTRTDGAVKVPLSANANTLTEKRDPAPPFTPPDGDKPQA
ncbi:MAG: hypothetical protein M3Y59_12180 [Myxococcota bacterium]|nr:hypothetical protein [Myxococcota bacterium]